MNITVPTNFPAGDRRTILVALAQPLPAVPVALVLVDCDGDVWRQAGMTVSGEPRMVCDTPLDPDERGTVDGGHDWTRREVESRFGPVRTLAGAA